MKAFLTFVALNFSIIVSAQTKDFIDRSAMDLTVKLGDNFYQYTNGKRLRTMAIPADQNIWGGFQTLEIENIDKLRSIFEKAYKENPARNSKAQKVADFYFSAMDTSAINKAGAAPLKKTIERFNAIKNSKDVVKVIAEGYKVGEVNILGFSVDIDAKESDRNIAAFYQSGLSLEKTDYDTNNSSTAQLRKALIDYAATLFILIGDDKTIANQKASYVLDLETRLSAAHINNLEVRKPELNYHKISIEKASILMPDIDWGNLLPMMDIYTDSINLAHPKYFEALNHLLVNAPIDEWKAKLQFDYINNKAWLLSDDFVQAKFTFFKVRWGWQSMWERWKNMVWYTNSYLGDLVGQLYVDRFFDKKSKRKVQDMVERVQKAFAARIKNLDWMSTATKQQALKKLAGVVKKIGYPDKWKNYDDVVIVKDDWIGNLESIERHNYRYMINKIDKPVDRLEWVSNISAVGGYYNAYSNELGLPAGGLQLPFFDPDADDAFNYGATGTIIGHELIHGFDDHGRKFDDKGNLKDWWTQEDNETYNKKAKALVYQFNQYRLFDSIPVNGELTLGENIADLGGVTIAYEAFKTTQQYKDHNKIDGLSPEQRFFFAYAQSNLIIARPDLARRLINIDLHPPVNFRINGTLSNFTPFYKAFNVTRPDKMFRSEKERITIW